MPFVAVNQDKERVDITDYASPKIELQGQELLCPYCEVDFVIVTGEKVSAHFRHKSLCKNPVAAAYFAGETDEHKQAKVFVKQEFVKQLREYTTLQPKLEVYVPEVRRIADVMICYPFGYWQAVEIQLSSITLVSRKRLFYLMNYV